MYLCVLSIKTIFSNILQHTYTCTVYKCNTEQKVIMMNGEEVFYIEHISVQLVLINVYSYDGLCGIWKQNTILRRNNIVLKVNFHYAGELRGFAHCVCVCVCVCVLLLFVCRVLRVWGMLSENVCKQLRKTVKRKPMKLFYTLNYATYQ